MRLTIFNSVKASRPQETELDDIVRIMMSSPDTEGRIFCYIPSADGCGCLHFFDEMFGGIMGNAYLCRQLYY